MLTTGSPATGGLVMPENSAPPGTSPIRTMPVPDRLELPLGPADAPTHVPAVRPGDRVRRGQTVAWPIDARYVPLHAPTSGHVAVAANPAATIRGDAAARLLIDTDGRDEPDPALCGCDDFTQVPADDLLARLAAGGIVGLGGAAFPAARKLARTDGVEVAWLLLNGVECEPGLGCDDALMCHRAAQVVDGARLMLHVTGAGRCVIALTQGRTAAAAALQAAITEAADDRLRIVAVPPRFPAGEERQLIQRVFGRHVPVHGLPRDLGIVCQNVATAAAASALVRHGEPLTRRIVTVTGRGVREPANVEVRFGTPIADVVAACGGYTDDAVHLVAGGLMTGQALPHDGFPVTATMAGVYVAGTADLALREPAGPCIRCGDCARACPASLLPQELLRVAALGDDAALTRFGLDACIECGCCDVVCPSRLPLAATFAAARRQRAAAAGAEAFRNRSRTRFAAHSTRLAALEAERQRKLRERRPPVRRDP